MEQRNRDKRERRNIEGIIKTETIMELNNTQKTTYIYKRWKKDKRKRLMKSGNRGRKEWNEITKRSRNK